MATLTRQRTTISPCIMSAELDLRRGQLLIDNSNNWSLHSIDDGACTAMYTTGTTRPAEKIPRPAIFAEDGDVVVTGSDHGKAYIFSRSGCHQLGALEHAKASYVQALAVSAQSKTVYVNLNPVGPHR